MLVVDFELAHCCKSTVADLVYNRLPARYGDVLEVRIGLAAIGRTSFTYEYEIVDAEKRLVATARSVQVMYDYQAGRPVPIPDAIRRLLEGVDRAV